eukprot:133587-Prymnesium_polylepis.2
MGIRHRAPTTRLALAGRGRPAHRVRHAAQGPAVGGLQAARRRVQEPARRRTAHCDRQGDATVAWSRSARRSRRAAAEAAQQGDQWRWQCPTTLFGVASLIKKDLKDLRDLLKIEEPLEELPESWEVIDAMETENETLQTKVHALESDVKKTTAKAKDAHQHAAQRLKSKNRAATEARQDERAKVRAELKDAKAALATKLRGLREQDEAVLAEHKMQTTQRLEEKYADTFGAQRKGLNVALAGRRAAEKDAAKASRKVARLEKQIDLVQLDDESDDESDDEEEGGEKQPPSPVAFELMPRRDESSGRFQAESPELRVVRWAPSARAVHPTTVSHNIQDVLELIAPGLEVPGMSDSAQRQIRTEVTLAGEARAAWKFASCVRVLEFGWDESTKFGNGVFLCNMQVKNADGSIENVCLRVL